MENYVTGTAIRTRREQLGITQQQLADRLAVSNKTISKWENGRGLPVFGRRIKDRKKPPHDLIIYAAGCIFKSSEVSEPLTGRYERIVIRDF